MTSSSGPMELKREIAAQKKVLFSQLRGEATALNAVKVKRNDMGVWEPSTRRGANVSREAFTRHGREIASLLSYFENLHSPVLDVISNDKFELKYQFYGDIDREAVLGSNTMTATIPVHWEKNDIDVYLYPGELDKLMSKARLAGAAREHIPNRDEVAKNTGWDRNAVRQFPDNRMHLMQGLLENMQAGQQKLTRLVKGFLILLEIVERGAVDFTIGDRAHIVYGPNEVVGAYERGGSAYVWNSKPSSTEHTAVILGMCRSYPPPQFGSHVYIPSDADVISEVSQGLPLDRNSAVTLTPSLVYSSILTYAMDTSCIGLIQEAQLIACSLHENRYFTNVGLPKVVSQYDLMVPAFIAQHSALETSITSKELSKSIGRVHQMLAMVIAKDVIGAAHMQSKRGFSVGTTIRSYLNGNSSTVLQMASQATGLSILNKTSRMRLFEKLDEDNYSDILNETIFEGLWLVRDGKIFVNNGPISHLLDGAKDRTDNDTSYNVLKEELILGNVTIEDKKMPDGAFSTSWVSACRQRPVSRQSRPKVWRSLTLTKDCNYGPDNDLKKQGRRIRSQRNRDTKTVSRTVPVTYALRSPPRSRESSDREMSVPKPVLKGRKVSIESEPPSYGRSSSPVTESDHQRESVEGLFAAEENASAEEPVSPMHSRGRSTLERIRSRMDDELVENDLVDTLRNAKLKKNEREEWLVMIRSTVGIYPASKRGSMRGIIDLLREYGDVHADEKLSGNSKWKKLISDYDLGTRSGLSVSDMKQSGVNWKGDVTQENREGWKFIANSEPWKQFLFDHGVPDESTVFGSAARYTYARILSAIDCDVEGLGRFHKIFDNTSKNLVWPEQLDINAVRGMPSRDNMAWRRGDTSLGMRGMNQEDSQMLYLAAYYPEKVFNIDMLKKLCGEFNVPRDVREELSDTYGLFQRQT